MSIADIRTYLADVVDGLNAHWPDNRTINIVCHGHSVPAGYFATPRVDTFNAYPHLLHRLLKDRFPFAVLNVIVTAIGGETSAAGAERFDRDVLGHRPDVVTIDYGLNDRGLGLAAAEAAWRRMIEAALHKLPPLGGRAGERGSGDGHPARVLLLTPTPDVTLQVGPQEQTDSLRQHAEQIRRLAGEYQVALVDSLAAFEAYVEASGDLTDLLSWTNHPNRRGHELVAERMLRWFAILGFREMQNAK